MREMDRLTIQDYGVPSLTLMESAGEGIAKVILERFSKAARKGILVVAGKGNNGGDGFVVARLLKQKRIPCEVALLARRDELTPDAAHNLSAFLKRKGKVVEIGVNGLEQLGQRMSKNGLLVDAILGTGVKSEVRGLYGEAITLMNASACRSSRWIFLRPRHRPGVPLGVSIQAEMTVALGYPKLGEVIYPGLSYVGELVVSEIGTIAAPSKGRAKRNLIEKQFDGWCQHAIPIPTRNHGHLLVMAGSREKPARRSWLVGRRCAWAQGW
jgi:NAD(P)H-hydrate epimerase